MRLPRLRVWLVVVWVALWGDLSVANVASGVVLALVVPAALRGAPRVHAPIRPLQLLRFLGFFLVNLVRSNVDVARYVLSLKSTLREGILAVPLQDPDDDLVATVVANAITLTPGTLSLELVETVEGGERRRTLYVHLLDVEPVESRRTELLTVEYMALRAFGREEAIAALVDPRRRRPAAPGLDGRAPR